VAQRQDCRGRSVEHQPIDAEESEGQVNETAEGKAGRRESDALQANATGDAQAEVDRRSPELGHALKLVERFVVRHAFNSTPFVGCTGNGQYRTSIRVTYLADPHASHQQHQMGRRR